MAVELYSNNGSSTLNGAINNSITSLTVTSAASFPATPNFRILIGSEIMLVTGVAGAVFTVTRGAESTVAASHGNLDPVTQSLTNGGLTQGIADRAGAPCGTFTSTSTVANNTTVVFSWTAVLDDGYLSAGTKFIVPHKGYYLFNAFVHWDPNSVGFRIIEWRLNGTLFLNGSSLDASTNPSDVRQEVTFLILMNAGDYLELTAFQNCGFTRTPGIITASVAQIKAVA